MKNRRCGMHILVAHDDPLFLQPLVLALRTAGHEVSAFANSMLAWDALNDGPRVDILVTRVRFPKGNPHGVALAHSARANHPDIRILFTASQEMRHHIRGIGEFLAMPVRMRRYWRGSRPW
jgi:DNA-binding response OmpR family regulator